MYDEKTKSTKLMRTKENAIDYRFIQEPDLPGLIVSRDWVNSLRKEMPLSPQEKLKILIKKYNISEYFAGILTKEIGLVGLFEEVASKVNPDIALRWIVQEFLSVVNYNKLSLEDFDIKSEHFVELLKAIEKKSITENKGKDILRMWAPSSFSPKEEIAKSKKISREETIAFAKEVIKENKKAVNDYKSGFKGAINFLIGAIMKKSNKKADFGIAKEVLEDLLK
jgi:aspartyl-tRNA(Asn)/glutamyl-tRNA(Gln) amidotransferase subunit B